ncbi:E3 ubiquitin-protein ligase TRIM65 [Mantella aurantiaca]
MSDAQRVVDAIKSSLSCSICLDIFTNPLSLGCGHSFCQACIHAHWDALALRGDPIKCPECRMDFPERPEPQKNFSLHKAAEELKELERRKIPGAPGGGGHKGARTACRDHGHHFVYYCLTERRCLCYKCHLKTCRDIKDMEEHSEEERRKLSNGFDAVVLQKDIIEKDIEEWKRKSQNIKDTDDTLLSRVMAKFDQAHKTLEKCQTLVVESVRCEEKTALDQISDHLQLLQHHFQDLNKYHAEANQLLDTRTSDAEFLEGLPRLAPVGCAPVSPNVQFCGTTQMDAVTRILLEVTRLLQEELPNALHPVVAQPGAREISVQSSSFGVTATCCPPQTSRPVPAKLKYEPDTNLTAMSALRTQLFQDYRNLTFDPETANKHIEISQRCRKAAHKTRGRDAALPGSPGRFESWQVMCAEGFSQGSHYWEVEISAYFMQIGVAYASLRRTKGAGHAMGRNGQSWSLELRSMGHSAWHGGKESPLNSPMHRRIGVHLDCAAGGLTFYGVKDGGRLECLHAFHAVFQETLHPVFFIGEDVNVKLHHEESAAGI